jgi:diaminopimelate decarboxylase
MIKYDVSRLQAGIKQTDMDHFRYLNGKLFCEEVDLDRMSAVKTPFYLYSWNTFRDHFLRFKESFREVDPLICFAVKTCNNVRILKGLAGLGAGMDIVSGGELFLSKVAGVSAEKIVYAGVGKTAGEISDAIAAGIGYFNIESEPEFVRIEEMARAANRRVNALLRVNPDEYDEKTHEKTNTGKKGGKFGMDIKHVPAFFGRHGGSTHLRLAGLHIHIGSPIYSPEPYVRAIGKVTALIERLQSAGFPVHCLDIGGGYAADYEDGASPTWEDYAKAIIPALVPLTSAGVRIIMEPGRTISANAGILVTEVQYVKQTGAGTEVVITDTGMHHLIRPALYGAEHFIWPVNAGEAFSTNERKFDLNIAGLTKYDIAGPICESSDYLAKARKLPPVKAGDRLAVFTAGAYGIVMSSQYNAQPRPAEYLTDRNRIIMIRERESYEDLTGKQCESIIDG